MQKTRRGGSSAQSANVPHACATPAPPVKRAKRRLLEPTAADIRPRWRSTALIFLAGYLAPALEWELFLRGALLPELVVFNGEVYRLFTAMFLHGSLGSRILQHLCDIHRRPNGRADFRACSLSADLSAGRLDRLGGQFGFGRAGGRVGGRVGGRLRHLRGARRAPVSASRRLRQRARTAAAHGHPDRHQSADRLLARLAH